jgi:hypothetical protein
MNTQQQQTGVYPSSFEEVSEWLRREHGVRVTPTYAGAGEWQCSCGAENGPGTRLTWGQAKANADRHLRAARRRFLASASGESVPCRSGHTDCTVDCGWCKGTGQERRRG